MQISDLLNNYIVNTSQAKLSQDAMAGPAAKANSTLLDLLPQGSIFEGSVLAVDGEKVTLGFANGTSLLARLDAGVQIEKGQSVFFQVKSNDGFNIALKSISSHAGSNPIIEGALNNAGVRVSGESILMIDSMMREGMPVDTESVLSMNKQLLSNPGVNPQTIVEMNKFGIPVNPENVQKYEAFVADNLKLGEDITSVSEDISKIYSDSEVPTKELLSFTYDLVETLDKGIPNTEEKTLENSTLTPSQEVLVEEDTESSAKPVLTLSEGETKNLDIKQVLTDKEFSKLEQGLKEIPEFEKKNIDLFTSEGSLKPDIKARDMLKAVTDFTKEEYSKLEDSKPELPQHSEESIRKLISSKPFAKLIIERFDDAWRLSPEQTADKEMVKKQFAKINLDMQKIYESLDKLPQDSASTAKNSIEKLTGNVNFQNQVNDLYNFIQIPLKMTNQNATGELYVYSGKKGSKMIGDKDELTAFLHFDLEHLGSTDISVKLKQKTNVSCDWVLEDEISMRIIEENIGILEAQLNKKGYNCSFSVTSGDEAKSNFVADFLRQDTHTMDTSMRRYSFDMQA